MRFQNQIIRKYPFSVVCICLIWVLSLTPFLPETPLDNVVLIDKWVHIVMYGGTCGVIWLEYLRQHSQPDYGKLFFWAFLAPIAMSGVLELMQEYLTTTRNGSWLDLAANAIGVTLAGLAGAVAVRFLIPHSPTASRGISASGNCSSDGRPSPPVR